MSAAWGIVGGALALLALKSAVGAKGSSELSGGFKVADSVVSYIIDPSVPLIPDRRQTKAAGGGNDNPAPAPKQKTPTNPKGGDTGTPGLPAAHGGG